MNSRRRGLAIGIEPLEVRALLSGETVQLIKDVNTAESYPADLTPAGSNLFYLVKDSSGTGSDLVVTNAGGTQNLGDSGGTSPTFSSVPYDLTAVGNDLYFLTSGGGGSSYETIGVSDGTVDGTTQVSGLDSVNDIESLTALGSVLLFRTQTYNYPESEDYQLWSIAGPGADPSMIHDFGPSVFYSVATIGGTEYLSVGGNLWTTDGTAGNTQEVEDGSGNAIAVPDSIFLFDGQTYYYDSTADTIGILGSSGETPEVTLPDSASAPVVVGTELYFTAEGASGDSNNQLWSSDGTQANTQLVEDFSTVATVLSTASPSNLTDADGSLFFTVSGTDGLNQLWTSNGTGQGTMLVKDLGSNASAYSGYYGYGYSSSNLGLLAPVGNTLFFMASDSTNGAELWSDNVPTGTTQLVANIAPGAANSDPNEFVAFNNQLYFAANDGATPLANELWSANGSGAALVASFTPGLNQGSATSSYGSSNTTDFATVGSELLLPLDDGIHGTALWATDGTAAGTTLLSEVDPQSFAILNGTTYFLGHDQAFSYGLWKTDGTAAGTVEVKDLSQLGAANGYYGSSSGTLVASGNLLYYTTSDGSSGVDLWASDGTANGTSLVKDFTGGTSYSDQAYLSDLTAFGGKLAFIAQDAADGTQVWITDGTSTNTVMLTDLSDESGTSGAAPTAPNSLTIANDQLFFLTGTPGGSSSSPQGLWVSDGTVNGTSEFDPSLPSITYAYEPYGSSGPTTMTATPTVSNLTAVGSNVYFSLDYSYYNGESSVEVDQLWITGGTLASTTEVSALANGSSFTSLSSFHALGNLLLFEADDSSGALSLWKSDGTQAGTSELKIINPLGAGYDYYGNSANTVVNNGVLYFVADDGTDGSELWETDGTSVGTFMVDDINPGASSSNPVPLAVVNGHVVLLANDGIHGDEPMEVVSTGVTNSPEIETIPEQDITVGETLQFGVNLYASDPNNPSLPLSYTLTGDDVPSGASIDPTTGVFTWLTAGQPTGPYSITVQVSDNNSPALIASETFTVNVDPLEPPVLSIPSYEDVTVGETFSLDVSQYASDPNTPPFLPLTYSLTGTVPSGASINPTTGVLTWATSSNQVTGAYSFTVEVSDNASPTMTSSQTFSVSVNSLESPIVETIPGQGVNIGSTLTFNVSTYAFDPNSPPFPLSYSLIGTIPAGASIDPTTGVFTWTPSSNQPIGNVTIDVQVSNSQTPLEGTGTFVVEVGATGATLSPLLAAIPTQTANAGQTNTAYLSSYASDPNRPALSLTYSLTGTVPSGASIDPATGTLTWITPSDQPAGLVSFTLMVSDSSSPPLTASETFSVNVISASGESAPVLQTIPTQNADIGSALQVNVSGYASDPNFPALPLTYSLGTGAPDGASIDQNTGIFTWAPAADQATVATPITVIVTDNQSPAGTAMETFTVNVFAAGTILPPNLTLIPSQYVTVGQTLQVDISQYASDPNSPVLPLTYSLVSGAPSGMSIDATTGLLTWTPTSDQAAGPTPITVLVADNQSPALYAMETFSVDAFNLSVQTPYLTNVPTLEVELGGALTFDFSNYVSNPNTPPVPVTYSLGADSPSDASIDPNSGIVTWTPDEDQATGPVDLTVVLTDSQQLTLTSSQTFQVQVYAAGTTLPVGLGSIPGQNATIGQQLQVDLSTYAVDFNSPQLPLTYSLIGDVPSGASIDPDSGIFTWTPTAEQPIGSTEFELNVSNGPSSSSSEFFFVTVAPAVTILPPVLQSISTQSVMLGQELEVDLTQYASDPNDPALPLTYSLGPIAPPGASIDSSGLLTWTPALNQPTGLTLIMVLVSDNQSPPNVRSETFTVNVTPAVTTTTIAWTNPADIVYGTALSGTQLDALASVDGTYQYTPALGAVLTAGEDQPLMVAFTPSDTIDYSAASASVTINVTKATPDVSVNSLSLATGTALANSQLSGTATWIVGGTQVNVPGTYTFTSAAGITLGAGNGQTESVSFTPQDTADYNSVSTSVTINVGQSSETVSVNPVNLTYGTAFANSQLSGTATAMVNGSQVSLPGTFTYTSAAGTTLGAGNGQTESATFTPQNSTDYSPVTTNVTINVARAAPVVSANPVSLAIGTALANSQLSGTATWVVGVSTVNVAGTYAYTSAAGTTLEAGNGQIENVTFTPQDTTDYSTVATTVTVNVGQFVETVSVNPVNLTYGTALANGQLSGTATATVNGSPVNIAGTYIYQSAAGIVLGAGNGQAESVTFTPQDTADYTPLTTLVPVNVARAAPVASVNPVNLTYGTALANGQLGGTATWMVAGSPVNVAGTYTYTSAAGTVLGAANGQAESVTFTPQNSTDYTTVTINATVNVARATPNVSVNPVNLSFGTALANAQLSGSASWTVNGVTVSVPGTFSYKSAAGTVLNAGSGQTESVIFTPQDSTDYITAAATATINVSAPPPVTLTLSAIPTQTLDVGQGLQLDLSRFASETNAPTLSLTYSLGSGAPSGASINPTTGLLTWSTGTNQPIGNYPITVQVADNGSPQRTASETLNVNVSDPNPVTISAATVTTKKGFTITLTFSGAVNPGTASNSANYILTEPAKKPKSKKKPTPPPIRIALSVSSYNQATNQVILKGPKKVKTSPALTLTVVGTGPNGIAKLDGLQLAGSGGGPGTNYVASVTGKAVNRTSAVVARTVALVRHSLASHHMVKVVSTRPAGPMALARTPVVRDVVLGVIPSETNPLSRTRHG